MTGPPARPVVWLVCELYHPELASTGWYVTGLAEALAVEFDVRVICARPNYAARGQAAPAQERRNGVTIHRCATPAFDTHRLWRRAAGALVQTGAMLQQAWRRFEQGQTVIVVTNPPTLPYGVVLLARWRGLRSVLYVNDLFPDALVCAGLLRPSGPMLNLLQALTRWLYDKVDCIVADGRDARALIASRTSCPRKVCFIPYWAEPGLSLPSAKQPGFVVLYSGNMGRLHELPTLLDAALLLREHPTLRWVLRGTGVRRLAAEAFVRRHSISNLCFAEPCAWDGLATALAEGDIGIVALVAGTLGVATPSRMYNLLAAGKPIVAVADNDTELAMLVQEQAVGWVVRPGDAVQLADLLRRLADDAPAVQAAGERALTVAACYTRERSVAAFGALLRSLNPAVSEPTSR